MRFLLRVLKSLDEGAAYLQRVVLILVSIFVICTMSTEVIARYVFQAPIWGMDELTGHIAVWLYLIGAAYGTYDRSHIKAEFIHLIIKNRHTLIIIRAVATAIATVMASYMVVWSYGYVHWSIIKHEVTPTLQWPTVYFQFPILVAAILMSIYFLVETLDCVRDACRQRAPGEGGSHRSTGD